LRELNPIGLELPQLLLKTIALDVGRKALAVGDELDLQLMALEAGVAQNVFNVVEGFLDCTLTALVDLKDDAN